LGLSSDVADSLPLSSPLPTYGTATIWNSRESDGFYWNYSWRIHFPNGRVDVVT
jgi:hypothetical protein